MSSITGEELAESLRVAFNEHVLKYFEGEYAEDFLKFSEIMLNNVVAAISSGDQIVLDSVKRTARGLVELGRIQVVNATWDVIDSVIDYFVGIAKGLVTALVAKITVVE